MSNIIKSFRVVEKTKEDELIDGDKLRQNQEETRHKEKYIEVVNEAKKEAQTILDQAKKEGQEIIDQAGEKAKQVEEKTKIESKNLLEEAKENGYNIGNEQGYRTGYDTGYKEGQDQAQSIIDQALDIKEQNLITRDEIAKELEPDILKMIIKIYEKIIGDKTQDQDFILDLIRQGIADLDPTDNLTIIVSKEDYDKVLENKEAILAGASFINNLNIKYDINFKHNDCIFEMDKGNIDLSLDGQMDQLKKTILKILDNE